MKKRDLTIIFILILVLGGLFFYSLRQSQERNLPPEQENTETPVSLQERKEIINDVEKKLYPLSPVKPEADASWSANRFGFVNHNHFYVEYSDGEILRRLLLEKEDKGSYKVVGFFEPGENLWNLVQGSDPYFGESVDIYEKSDDGQWVQVN